MKNSIIILIAVLFISCKDDFNCIDLNEKKYAKIIFNNKNFKVALDSFINISQTHPINDCNSILIYIESYNNDTVLRLKNRFPFERNNLKGSYCYRDFELYFYLSDTLENVLNKFIKHKNKDSFYEIKLDSNVVDPVFIISYDIVKDTIKKREIPLEWSTDSIIKKR